MNHLHRKNKTEAHRGPQTEAQALASRENFAIFQLRGMLGNIQQINRFGYTPVVNPAVIDLITKGLKVSIEEIQEAQRMRKELKK